MPPGRAVIGLVSRPHGVRGEIRVESLTDRPDRFARLSRVWLVRAGTELGEFDVESSRALGKAVGLKLHGLDTPEAVAALRGVEIQAEPLSADDLPAGTYYVSNLVGLDVRTDEGEPLGVVAEVMSCRANDVLVVRHGASERLLPLVGDVIVKIDLGERVVVVHVLPGLLEL